MGSQIQISSPFIKSFSHTTTTLGTSLTQLLDYAPVPVKRVSVVIQNQSTGSQNLIIILNSTDTDGIIIPPLSSYVLDNYNGQLYAKGSASSTIAHIAVASV